VKSGCIDTDLQASKYNNNNNNSPNIAPLVSYTVTCIVSAYRKIFKIQHNPYLCLYLQIYNNPL